MSYRLHALRALCLAVAAWPLAAHAQPIDFNRDVRPILSNKCIACHGPDANTREANLRLDTPDGLFSERDGNAAFVPHHPDKSAAIERILSDDEFARMPPADSNKSLTAAERETLVQWVKQGATWQPHWAFISPKLPAIPNVQQTAWPQNAIDRFILAKLEGQGWTPSKPANRETLIRRVSLDLIGLPPTPDEVDAFVQDDRPDAYRRLVDRLLESPHYGERWARRWLDLARYADTNGYEKDRPREIWPYRDWVIKALNADMPFDQFTIKQLAGDMLPNPTQDDLIATGFHRNTMLNEEGGIDPLEFRYLAMVDRVATTGTTWLGLTTECSQCHDHKYDPISHREYFGLMAFLNNADEPELPLPNPTLDAQHAANLEKAAKLLADLPNQWPSASKWQPAPLLEVRTQSGETPKRLPDGSLLFTAPGPDQETYTLILETEATSVAELQLLALADENLPRNGPGRVPHGNFVLSEIRVAAGPRENPADLRPVPLASATATGEQAGFPPSAAIDGKPNTGWAIHNPSQPWNKDHQLTLAFASPVEHSGGVRFVIEIDQHHGQHHTIGRLRIDLPTATLNADTSPAQRATAAFEKWITEQQASSVAWRTIRPNAATSNLPLLTIEPDDTVFVSGDTTKQDTYELTLPLDGQPIRAIRLEALPDPRLPEGGPGMTYYEGPRGDFFLNEFHLFAGGQRVPIASATQNYANSSFGGNGATAQLTIDDDFQTGWSIHGRQGERHQAVYQLAEPLSASAISLKMTFGRHYPSSLGRFRISVTNETGAQAHDFNPAVEQLLAQPPATWTAAERQQVFEEFLLSAAELAERAKQIRSLRKQPDYPSTLIFKERPPENPRPTFIHNRGEYLQATDEVAPESIAALHPFPETLPNNRLGFAQWLMRPENPLTARVVVNRHWSAFFGRGLVPTLQDFGFQGETPSHPELLDWLALELQRQDWSIKSLHREIVLSATYQQSYEVTEQDRARDPNNIFLGRAPRLRLEAEVIRDAALVATGQLVPQLGGPPVRPPQPPGVTESAYGSPTWNADSHGNRYRRGIYTFTKRTAPFAMFSVFDAPSGEECIARRDVSNSPLQSLTLLNDEMFVELARALGKQLATQPQDDAHRATQAFRRILARNPTPQERARLVKFVTTTRENFRTGGSNPIPLATGDTPAQPPENTPEIATWTALTRALLALDETITRP